MNIIKFSRGVALNFFQIWFIKKWVGVGVWVSPVIVTKAKLKLRDRPMSIPRLYLIYKRDKTSQNLPEGAVVCKASKISSKSRNCCICDVILTNLDDP